MEQNVSEKIDYNTFLKIDLRTATVLEAEKVEGSDKLLKLKIDLGYEQRQLVAGIAHMYKPEEIIGKQIIIVANLEPRKIRGVESNGMLLAVENSEGKIILITTSEKTENGLKVH
ncbi:MAG: methionine--tRNA ligase subunit beta [Candidatus Micrarchaeia archaeon]